MSSPVGRLGAGIVVVGATHLVELSRCSRASSSSRMREPWDSTRGFCQGEPGSMYLVLVFANLHQ